MEEFHLCSQFYTYSCVPALVRAKTTNDWFLSPGCSDDTDPAMVVPLPPVLRQSGSKLHFIPGAPEWLFFDAWMHSTAVLRSMIANRVSQRSSGFDGRAIGREREHLVRWIVIGIGDLSS